jgi:hypothetical protein
MRDLKSNIDAALSLAPAARTATAQGSAVDLQGYDGAAALVQFGTWTDGTHTPSLEESDDGSAFTAVVAADLVGAFTAVSGSGGSNSVQRVGYIGRKRYLRAVLTVSGATTGALTAASILRGIAHRQPV